MAAIVPPQAQQLELAHVLFLDVADSSSLSASQHHAALQNLQEFIERTSEFCKARARDQITVTPCGDGMAVVFSGDPETPLRCAVEISRCARSTNKFRLRMGLHCWPESRMGGPNFNRMLSDTGINLAQKIMDCGDHGHILVSDSVAAMLRQLGRWNDALHELGEIDVNEGIRLHLFNFWNSEAGNPEVPNKVSRLNSLKNLDPAKGNKKDRSEES